MARYDASSLTPGRFDAIWHVTQVRPYPTEAFMLELRSRVLCVLQLQLGAVTMIGATPAGTRRVVQVVGGRFDGERLRGNVLGGGDWSLEGPDGALRLDSRSTLCTDDGALLYLQHQGVRHGPPEVLQALLHGEAVAPERYYFRTAMRFESGDARYEWLHRCLIVGVGERRPEGPRYTVHEIL